MASSYLEVGSAALTELKTDLLNLSASLHEIYDLMNADMTQVGEAWRDGKYEEFISGYKPQINKCEEISQRYTEWCHRVLEPAIEEAIEIETTDVGGDGSVVSGSVNTGTQENVVSSDKKKSSFLAAINKMNKEMEEHRKNAVIKHVIDPGADPNERVRRDIAQKPNPAIINGLLNGRGR